MFLRIDRAFFSVLVQVRFVRTVTVPTLHSVPSKASYDHEPATVDAMHRFMEEQGYTLDITDQRMHHEIYLSDARRVAPEKLKTVVRHPIKTMGK